MAGKALLHHKNKLATFGNNPKIASPTSHHHSRNQQVRHNKVQRLTPRTKGLMNSKGIRGELY
jgi:hypothetical protein